MQVPVWAERQQGRQLHRQRFAGGRRAMRHIVKGERAVAAAGSSRRQQGKAAGYGRTSMVQGEGGVDMRTCCCCRQVADAEG